MVGCRKPLKGIISLWWHRGKIAGEWDEDFWKDFIHTPTNAPIACGDQNHGGDARACCDSSYAQDSLLCERCCRKLGYIW